MLEATLVFLGGSADLSRWVGALKAIQQSRVEYPRIVASSTASPVAAFVASGYTIGEIQESWNEFKARTGSKKIDANEIADWVSSLLKKKGVETFGDLKNARKPELKLLVQDVNDPAALMLPDDAAELGIREDELSVVSAVRAAMGIPDVQPFAPIRLGTRELAGCYWGETEVPLSLEHIVLPQTTPLSFYSEPIVGATTLVRRFFSQRARRVLELDKQISRSRLVRQAVATLASKPRAVEVPSDDESAKEPTKMVQLINLSSLPSWFSVASDDLLEAAMNETKRELIGLGIPPGIDVKVEHGAGHPTVKNEAGVLIQPAEAQLNVTEERHVNAWIVDGEPPLEKGTTYKFAINVGKLCEHTTAAPRLSEFDWKDDRELDVWIVLSGYHFTVKPSQQKFTLPKQGDTDPIFFALTPTGYGSVLLRISLYFARELTLLQEFEVPIPVKESVRAA